MADMKPVQTAQNELNTLVDKDADSTNSDVRYMAYGARLRTALRAGHRYIAYVRRRRQLIPLTNEFTRRLVMSARRSAP